MHLPPAGPAGGSAPPPAGLGCFSHTGHALRVMERVAAALSQQEPVLLVGETGTGKTTTLSHLAGLVSRGRGCGCSRGYLGCRDWERGQVVADYVGRCICLGEIR